MRVVPAAHCCHGFIFAQYAGVEGLSDGGISHKDDRRDHREGEREQEGMVLPQNQSQSIRWRCESVQSDLLVLLNSDSETFWGSQDTLRLETATSS